MQGRRVDQAGPGMQCKYLGNAQMPQRGDPAHFKQAAFKPDGCFFDARRCDDLRGRLRQSRKVELTLVRAEIRGTGCHCGCHLTVDKIDHQFAALDDVSGRVLYRACVAARFQSKNGKRGIFRKDIEKAERGSVDNVIGGNRADQRDRARNHRGGEKLVSLLRQKR